MKPCQIEYREPLAGNRQLWRCLTHNMPIGVDTYETPKQCRAAPAPPTAPTLEQAAQAIIKPIEKAIFEEIMREKKRNYQSTFHKELVDALADLRAALVAHHTTERAAIDAALELASNLRRERITSQEMIRRGMTILDAIQQDIEVEL